MNRQQRRISERRQVRGANQRRVAPANAWMAMKVAMVKSDMSDLDDKSKLDIMTPTYMCLQRLQFGTMDRGDFIHLCEWNSIGGELAYRLQFHDKTGQIGTAGHQFMAAADALNAIGLRQSKTGSYGATGDELQILRNYVQLLEQLLDLAPRGVIVTAMEKIRRLIDRRLGNRDPSHRLSG